MAGVGDHAICGRLLEPAFCRMDLEVAPKARPQGWTAMEKSGRANFLTAPSHANLYSRRPADLTGGVSQYGEAVRVIDRNCVTIVTAPFGLTGSDEENVAGRLIHGHDFGPRPCGDIP